MTSFDDSRDQSHTFSRYAPALVSGGYSPVPIQEGSKRPLPALGDWSRLRSSPLTIDQIATIGDQHPYAGIGIVGGFGGVVPIDIDTDDPEITATIHSVLPATEVSKRGRRGSTLFFRCLEPISARKFRQSGGEGLLEILTSGQTVIPPTRHPQSGKPYEWADERYSLFNVPVNDLSIISAAHIAALESELSRWTGQPRISGSQTPGQSEEIRLRKCAEALLGSFFDRLQAAPEGSRNQLLFQATCTLGRFVHHGFLLRSDLERTLFEACDANGLMSADGRRACEATIVSGLRKAEGDEKPKLGDIESYSRSADSEAPGSKHSSVAKERGAVKRVDSLIDLALEKDIDLYHSRSGVPFADIVVDGHRETWPINGDGFRLWLRHSFYREVGGAVSGDVIKTALATLESMAIFDGEEREVFLRVAQHDTRIFLDLCDARWRAIEIDRDGWRIVDRPDVRFRRTGGMLEIPEPVPGSNIDDLRQQLNLGDESFVLAVSWLLAVLRGRGPYPILALSGEQGTGKSLSAQLMRSLVDPHEPAHGSLPRDVRDLYIGAINRHVLAFETFHRFPRRFPTVFVGCQRAEGLRRAPCSPIPMKPFSTVSGRLF
jgi:hypothetical protein